MRILAAVLLIAACGNDSTSSSESSLTYYQDIKPIIDAKCVGCHTDGGIGPFVLDSYDAVVNNAAGAAHEVAQKTMPPWAPNDDCREYDGDRSLTADQIDKIQQWVAADTPEGDASHEAAALPNNLPTMSRVDAKLAMPETYTPAPPSGETDDYRCFVLPWPAQYTSKTFVTGFRAVPGNASVVHHVIAFLAGPADVASYQQKDAAEPGPGYTCFGGTGGNIAGMIGGWAPGSLGSDLPAGIGLPIEAGSAIILQVHYNTHHGNGGADQSAIELKVDNTVERPGRVIPFTNPLWTRGGMSIAAGDADAMYKFTVDPTPYTGDLEIFSAAHHMHTLGTKGNLSVTHADGSKSCLLQIDNWDFHWQGSYGFKQSEILRRGDQLSIECHWDNSMAHQEHPGTAPKPVNWGEGTSDEMCIGFFLTAAPK